MTISLYPRVEYEDIPEDERPPAFEEMQPSSSFLMKREEECTCEDAWLWCYTQCMCHTSNRKS